jgi:hypothetical protein
MSEEFKSFTKDTLDVIMAAIDANKAEEVAAFGRYLPGAEFHEDEEVRWYLTGLPSSLFNGVQLAHFNDGHEPPHSMRGLAEKSGASLQALDMSRLRLEREPTFGTK